MLKVAVAAGMLALAAIPVSAQAPAVMVSGSAFRLENDLTPNTLVGPGVHGFTPPTRSGFMVHYGADRLTGTARRFGYSCGGFIPPGPCMVQEPLQDRARVFMATIGGSMAVVRRTAFSLSAILNLHGAGANVDTRGLQSGRSLKGNDVLIGVSAGGAALWQPKTSVPVALRVSGNIGAFKNLYGEQCCDSYEPFASGGLGMRQLTLGLAWMRR